MRKLWLLQCFALTAGLILSGCSTLTSTAPGITPDTGTPTNSKPIPTMSSSPKATSTTLTSTPTQAIPNPTFSSIEVEPLPLSSDTTSAYQPPPLTSSPQFVTIKAGLVFGDNQSGTNIPLGSTIYHWKNKITEVIGADNSIVFIAKDTEATQIPTPGGGPQPATHVYQVPNGARISADPNNKNIANIYSGNEVIGTIVDKPEDFPYTPTQIRNTNQQYVAKGIYADGSAIDITSQLTWNSSNTTVATISSKGLVTALADGTTTITGSLNGITSLPVVLTVNSLSSISIQTWNGVGIPRVLASLPVGSTWQVWATGTYSDGSTADITSQVVWSSSDKDVATIDAKGLITGKSDGNDQITASLEGITSPGIAFKVVSLTSIEISAPTHLTIGSKSWLSAGGIYTDSSTNRIYSKVIWHSSNPSVATISTDGLVTAISEGTTNITASSNGIISKPVTLTVVDSSPTSTSRS